VKGGMVIELWFTFISAFFLILLVGFGAEWYWILGAAAFFVWCLRRFLREIKDRDVDRSAEARKRIEDKISRDSQDQEINRSI
jgi:fatty acid desaturase